VEYLVKLGNFFVATRDFVTINAERYDEKEQAYYTIGKSIDKYPKESRSKNYVRSEITYLGTKLCRVDDNSCEFWCVTQVHPRFVFGFIY